MSGLQCRASARIGGSASFRLARQLSLAPFLARLEDADVRGLILGMDGAGPPPADTAMGGCGRIAGLIHRRNRITGPFETMAPACHSERNLNNQSHDLPFGYRPPLFCNRLSQLGKVQIGNLSACWPCRRQGGARICVVGRIEAVASICSQNKEAREITGNSLLNGLKTNNERGCSSGNSTC
jgi:hypothetical protein